MKNKIFTVMIILIVALLLLFSYYDNGEEKKDSFASPEESATEIKKIKLVYLAGLEDVSFLVYFAEDKGFYEKYGLSVEKMGVVKSTSDIIIGGEADALITGPMDSLNAYMNDIEVRELAHIFKNYNFGVSKFPKEDSHKIKKVAINQFGYTGQILMNMALNNLNVNPKDVEIVAIPFPAQMTALSKGEIDFMTLPSKKFLNSFQGNTFTYYIFSNSEILNNSGVFKSLLVMENTINEKPEEMKNLTLALYESIKYMEKNSDETISYIENKFGISQEEAGEFYNLLVIEAGVGEDFIPNAETVENISSIIKKEFNPVNPNKNPIGFIYTGFAEEAVKK